MVFARGEAQGSSLRVVLPCDRYLLMKQGEDSSSLTKHEKVAWARDIDHPYHGEKPALKWVKAHIRQKPSAFKEIWFWNETTNIV